MWTSRERREALLVEYQLSQEMHNYYGKITWQIGAIFLGGSIGAYGIVISETIGKMPTPLPGWFWVILLTMTLGFILFLRRFRGLAHIHLQRCIEIEEELGLKQHTYAEEASHRAILIRGKCQKLPSPGGWVISVSLCIILLALTVIIALYMSGLRIIWN